MRLTTHTDFALRTLMFVATVQRRVTAAEVAQLYGISANHLAKAVNQLARLGYVRSIRGIGGGIELAREAESIRLGEVIQALEGNRHLLDCVGQTQVCSIESFCKLKQVLAKAEEVQMNYLYGVTLADVIPTKRQLQSVRS
jgi:Rrf2 family nitric oxide-sensitive transcriptional repressor